MVEDIVGKGEKCWLPAFSPFPTMFSKGFFCRVLNNRDCVGKTLPSVEPRVHNHQSVLKVALQIFGQNICQNTKKSSLYSQNLFIFIHRNPVVERHPITREIRDLLWPRSTPSGNTVYFYMSSTCSYPCSLKHSV